MAKVAKNRLNSTWTPLNNDDLNERIFNERRSLVGKWFEKWTDAQRLLVLEDLVSKCKPKVLEQVSVSISKRKPMFHDDFTRNFPRVLSIYVFSFLDPRSLCRCAQVSWHWKYITELDQLWMKKCLRLGWILSFNPSPYEAGLWKRLYVENIIALKNSLPSVPKSINVKELEKMALLSKTRDGRNSSMSSARLRSDLLTGKKPPWKGSDPTPKDTWRNNYLENDDEIEKVNKLRKKGIYGVELEDIQRRAKLRVNTGIAMLKDKRPSSLTRAKSVTIINDPFTMEGIDHRPTWATATGVPSSITSQDDDLDPSAAFRSVPMNSGRKSNLVSERSARDPPSMDLFPSKPWHTLSEDDRDSQIY